MPQNATENSKSAVVKHDLMRPVLLQRRTSREDLREVQLSPPGV